MSRREDPAAAMARITGQILPALLVLVGVLILASGGR